MAEHSFTLSTRVKISYAVVLAVLLVFTGRLYQLQLVYQEDFGQKSRENSVPVRV